MLAVNRATIKMSSGLPVEGQSIPSPSQGCTELGSSFLLELDAITVFSSGIIEQGIRGDTVQMDPAKVGVVHKKLLGDVLISESIESIIYHYLEYSMYFLTIQQIKYNTLSPFAQQIPCRSKSRLILYVL